MSNRRIAEQLITSMHVITGGARIIVKPRQKKFATYL